eukprot:g25696.t1
MYNPLAVPLQIGQCDCGVHIVGWTIDFLKSPEKFLQCMSSNDSLWFRDQTGTITMNTRMIRLRLAHLAREDSKAHPRTAIVAVEVCNLQAELSDKLLPVQAIVAVDQQFYINGSPPPPNTPATPKGTSSPHPEYYGCTAT